MNLAGPLNFYSEVNLCGPSYVFSDQSLVELKINDVSKISKVFQCVMTRETARNTRSQLFLPSIIIYYKLFL